MGLWGGRSSDDGDGIALRIPERKRAEEGLKRFNEELERRVAERTRELRAMNDDLVRSVMERENLQEQLRQAQKMESIGTLAGGIAHDFNNILNIIQGYASLLNLHADDNRQIAESVKVIQESTKRGAAVVQQLLTFARHTEPRMELTDLSQVIRQLASLLRETLPRTIDLKLELAAGLPLAMADPNQLTQALLNLCINARDAMPDGGTLTLKARVEDESKLREHPEAGNTPYVCVEVADTGLGIDEFIRSRIFDPFFTTKGIGKGTGLGLAVVYGIVKSHKGFIGIDSQPARGTKFRVFLPVGRSSTKEMPPEQSPAELLEGKGRTLLLVEDEVHTLRLLQTELEKSGFRILTAADGLTAAETFRNHRERIDLVLLDLGLPKLEGKEVLRRIKSEKPGVQVIVASGYLEPEVKLDLARSGVRAFINKPYSIEEIKHTLGLGLQEHSRNL